MTEVSTPPPILPPEGDPATRPQTGRSPRSRFWGRLISVVTVVAAVVGLSFAIPAQALGRITPGRALIDEDTVAQRPGSANPTGSRVLVTGTGVDEPDGSILFTTVAVDSDISIFDWLESEVDDDIVLRRRADVFGTRSVTENRERNLEMMRVSKDIAVVVALDHLGIASFEETGQAFQAVVEGGPADGLLVPGDVIIAIDGAEITSFGSLRNELTTKTPGDAGIVTVDNIDTLDVRDVEIRWGIHPDESVQGGFIGIESVVPRQVALDLPFDVDIDSGTIGGPSAGLAFTLTIIDLLTEGELTGGQNVAVTGTILGDGTVGPVGGVAQKAAAAHEAGAVAFIVPEAVVDQAISGARDMPVIPVATLDDALAALADLGGQTEDLEFIGP
jgi:PDZ domain-containing protein